MEKSKVNLLLVGTFLMPMVSYGSTGYWSVDVGRSNAQLPGAAVGDEPLFLAVRDRDLAKVTYLLDHGANVNAVYDKRTKPGRYSTPLTWAIVNNNIEMVRLLLARGANANAWMDDMVVPLVEAVEERSRDILDLLLDQPGIDVNAKQNKVIWYDEDDYERYMTNGSTFEDVSKSALDIAQEGGWTPGVQLLRAHGAR
jgi:ankyrin repeat protein